jgi:hypothetical protein
MKNRLITTSKESKLLGIAIINYSRKKYNQEYLDYQSKLELE